MIKLALDVEKDRPLRMLCLGAHSDDIEIGCGGTLLELAGAEQALNVRWVVFSGHRERSDEAQRSADLWLRDVDRKKVELHGFRDGFFPSEWASIKEIFEQIKTSFEPDIIFTHCAGDLHQDHRIINELTWNTFRNHLILEYEIPKYDGDLRTPNCYFPLSMEAAKAKARALIQVFESQSAKHWFDEELFLGLMRIRGVESCAPSGYAEAYYTRKTCLNLR
ncbi:MAG TPA: PIG-L deacetylase family protein [Pontiella sp.]|nr:PIG-L deacetylase family protein [Pontiella sp.]